jgi:hypothetical protein
MLLGLLEALLPLFALHPFPAVGTAERALLDRVLKRFGLISDKCAENGLPLDAPEVVNSP